MKTITFTCLFILFMLATGQAQTWAWTSNTTGNSTGVVNAVCSDANGNSFEAGYFYGSSINFGGFVLTKQGAAGSGSGCFIAKYNASGAVSWARTFGGLSNFDMIRAACTDTQGNLWVTGSLGSTMVTIGSITLTGSGSNAGIFIAKFDASGNVLWANRYNGNNMDEGTGICMDGQGDACISARYSSQSLVIGSATLTNSAAESALIAKFDSNGNLLWVQQPAGSVQDAAYAIASDGAGNFFLAGDFRSPTLGFGLFNVVKTGVRNAFLAKYDASGNALWGRCSAGNDFEYFRSVSTDAAGNGYVLGHYTSSVTTLGTFSLSQVAQEDVMIARYDAAGNVQWAKKITGQGRDIGHCVYVHGNRVFITGCMGSLGYAPGAAVSMGSLTLNPPAGYTDPMFFAQLDLSGNVQYAVALASGGYNRSAVCMDNNCYAYIGSNYANANSVPMTIGSNTLTYSIYENVFMARIDFSCDAVGIPDLKEDVSGIVLYPNPGSGEFTLDLSQESGRFELEIYTLLGQKVYEQTLAGGRHSINCSTLASGVYEYKVIKNTGAVKTGKLILQAR